MSAIAPTVVHEEQLPFEQWNLPEAAGLRWRTLLSADRTPTNALTVGVAELLPGGVREFRPHRHEQPELYYILSGEGVVLVAGERHAVRAGSAVFVPSMVSHCAVNTGDAPLRLLFVFPSDSFADVVYEHEAPIAMREPE